ncbi:MAG TPA: hypothetical protein PLU22_26695 [Polyangiaceae bacterium]|nr:hypothetical protein [Polyangiaceae bacterium]
MLKFLIRAAVVTALVPLAGCTTTRVVGMEAHPTVPVLHVESELWQGRSRLGTEFWTCVDQGAQIVCTRSCGPQMELKCPYNPTLIAVD